LAKGLSAERQDEVGEILMTIVDQIEPDFSAEQEAKVRRRLTNPEPGVPGKEMKALFPKLTG
jgi:hypothetical protein